MMMQVVACNFYDECSLNSTHVKCCFKLATLVLIIMIVVVFLLGEEILLSLLIIVVVVVVCCWMS